MAQSNSGTDPEDLWRRVRAFQITETNNQLGRNIQAPPVAYQGMLPAHGHTVQQQLIDPLEEQINSFVRKEFTLPEISDKFKDLVGLDLNADMTIALRDFPDVKMLGEPGIKLTILNPEEIIDIGRKTMPMLAGRFSTKSAPSVFILAYNLYKPGTRYMQKLFQGIENINNPEDKNYDYNETVVPIATPTRPIAGQGDLNEAAVYSYVAASLLRLFAKTPDNYCRAWNHIRDGFVKFYNDRFGVNIPVPTQLAVKSLADIFSANDRAKQSLYRILYISNGDQSCNGLKHFLYESHIAYTGMHAASFFFDLCAKLGCETETLRSVIDVGEFSRSVKCLVEILRMSTDKGGEYDRKMFKYGRIFDKTYMCDLQAKSRPRLIYILGAALRQEGSTSYRTFDQMYQLRALDDNARRNCEVIATRLRAKIRKDQNQRDQVAVEDERKS